MQSAKFDRLDLVVKFLPGQKNIGAIVYEFIDAISVHDKIAQEIETCLTKLDTLKKDFRLRDKKIRKLKAKFKSLNSKPKDYIEYQELIKRKANDPERIKSITDKKSKKVAELETKRYELLFPLCSKLVKLESKLIDARKLKDNARKSLIQVEKENTDLKLKEKEIAANISDDHITADERKCSFYSLFPNVHPRAQLMYFNNENVSQMMYEDILVMIKESSTRSITTAIKKAVTTAKGDSDINIPTTVFIKPVQTAVFQKYEYQFDWTTMTWISLEHLRQTNVCLEDLEAQATEFVASAGQGQLEPVQKWLSQGNDVDVTGYTGLTALHTSAAAGHIAIVHLLCEAEADCNLCDQNRLTPLLLAIRSGYLEIVELLIKYGGDVTVQDNQKRGVKYYALLSLNIDIIHRFYQRKNIDEIVSPSSNSTALHIAAELVADPVVIISTLLSLGASIYKLNNDGLLPEIIAIQHSNKAIALLLEQHRFMAPAQCIYKTHDKGMEIWVGKAITLQSEWMMRMDISHAICIVSTDDEAATQLPAAVTATQEQQQQLSQPMINEKFAHVCILDHYQPPTNDDDDDDNNNFLTIKKNKLKNKNNSNSSSIIRNYNMNNNDDDDDDNDDDESDDDKLLWLQITHYIPTIHNFTSHLFKSYRHHHHHHHHHSPYNATNPLRLLICDYDSISKITSNMIKTTIITKHHDINDNNDNHTKNAYNLAHNAIITSGNNISPAIACILLLLSQNERIDDTLKTIHTLRPSVQLSSCVSNGIASIQHDYDTRKSKRLDQKLRQTDILSCNF